MSDRGFLFLFSILMIAGGVGAAVYLAATGQAQSVDGLFLVLTALLVAVVFGLYVKYMVGRAMEETLPPKPQPAKSAAKDSPAKAAPVNG
jgi:membrane protein DedA with SNARE-associated domain